MDDFVFSSNFSINLTQVKTSLMIERKYMTKLVETSGNY